jgi:sulfofructose kinase
MSERTPVAVGIGCVTLDILIRAGALPSWEKQNTRFESVCFDGGGQAATAMVAVSRLGLPSGIIGVAGNDDAAKLKLDLTERYGVDVSRMVHRDEPDDSVVIVFVDAATGERMFFAGGRQGHAPVLVEELDRDYITSADYLLLDSLHLDASIQAAEWMREAGKTVVFDASTARDGKIPDVRRTVTPYVDVLISGAGFGQAFAGADDIYDAGKAVLEAGPRVFVQTEGDRGCHVITKDEQFHVPAFDVKVVDSTGAGDVFHGAFIVALAKGWNLHETARFSSAVSAITCTRLGGRTGIPSFDETMDFLNQ